MTKPNLNDNRNWEMIFNDEFNGTELNKKKWRIEQILPDFQGNKGQMSQHVTNTFGFDRNGNKGEYPHGKRHAIWYDNHHDKTIRVVNGTLLMSGYKSDEDDPTIKSSHHPYKHPRNGKTADFRKKIYSSWIDTYAMSWHDGALRPARKESPNFYYRYGYVEMGVNFEQVQTEGFRISGWLLPAVDPNDPDRSLVGKTYDSSAANGLECDIFEYENSPGCEHRLLCKNIGANAKKIPPVDCRKFGIDITKGDHTIAVYWDDLSMVWYVDGIEVCRDDRAIVHVSMALYITREGNSAVGGGDGAAADKPYRQTDYGLWGYNIGTESADTINNDNAAIRYIRVWQNPAQKNNWIAPGWKDGSGVENASDEIKNTPKDAPIAPKPIKVKDSNGAELDFDIMLKGNVMSWNDVNNNSKYDVKFNDNQYKTTVVGTSFPIPDDYDEGDYYVTSTPNGGPFINSESVTFSRKVTKIDDVVEMPTDEPIVAKPVDDVVDMPTDNPVPAAPSGVQDILDQIIKLLNSLKSLIK